MRIFFIGQEGSDAGGWYIGPDGKIHRVPGWNPEALTELRNVVTILNAAQQLKTPGLAEAATRGLTDFVRTQMGAQLKQGDVAVLS